MKIASYSPDLTKCIKTQILNFLEHEAEILMLPEYLLELTDFKPFPVPNKVVIFGSRIIQNQNCLFYSDGLTVQVYKKIKLTPWEEAFTPGSELAVFSFKGIKIAIMVCFDVEYPELTVDLRKHSIDLLLVPSATESKLGYERVSRCASSRAVELGCAVMTCHLVGTSQHEMIDVNVGNNNFFLPSQSQFDGMQRGQVNSPESKGGLLSEFELPTDQIRRQRTIKDETNPSIGLLN